MKKILLLLLLIPWLVAAGPISGGPIQGGEGGGGVPLATNQETITGTDSTKAVTPAGINTRLQAAPIVKAATGTITATEMSGRSIVNTGQTADAAQTMDAILAGYTFNYAIVTTVGKYNLLVPQATEHILLDGTDCGAGKYVGVASAVAGAVLSCKSFANGIIFCSQLAGLFACEP